MKEKIVALSPSPEQFDSSRCDCVPVSTDRTKMPVPYICQMEQRLDKIQEIARIAYWIFDMETGNISWSRQVFNLLKHGETPGFRTFREFLMFYSTEDSHLFREALARAVRSREKQEIEMLASFSNGETVRHRCTMIPELDRDGKVNVIQGYLQDITSTIDIKPDKPGSPPETGLVGVQTLSGLLPICSHCKKIRDDHGSWKQIETYLTERSNLFFSHGICPECLTSHYSEYFPLNIALKPDPSE